MPCRARYSISSGAMTVRGKSGSKTGPTHIADWGEFLGILTLLADRQPLAG